MKHENALALARPQSLSKVKFRGRWRNELNSTMTLHVSGKKVGGRYTSLVSSTGKKVSGPVTGFVSGEVISFVVSWPRASITAWVGQMVLERKRQVIETLWQMTSQVPDPENAAELWESVNCGADRFYRVKTVKKRKRK
jgi:hypothetical protein